MDRIAEKIIEELLAYKNGGKCTCALTAMEDISADITISELSQKMSISEEEVRATVFDLAKEGYLEYVYFDSKTSTMEKAAFHLSHKGMVYPELKQKKLEMENQRKKEISALSEIANSARQQASAAEKQVKAAKWCSYISLMVSIISALAAVVSAIVACLTLT